MLQVPLHEKSLPLFKRIMSKHESAQMEAVVAYELREVEQRNRDGDMVQAVSHVLAMRKKGKGFKDAASGVRSKL